MVHALDLRSLWRSGSRGHACRGTRKNMGTLPRCSTHLWSPPRRVNCGPIRIWPGAVSPRDGGAITTQPQRDGGFLARGAAEGKPWVTGCRFGKAPAGRSQAETRRGEGAGFLAVRPEGPTDSSRGAQPPERVPTYRLAPKGRRASFRPEGPTDSSRGRSPRKGSQMTAQPQRGEGEYRLWDNGSGCWTATQQDAMIDTRQPVLQRPFGAWRV